MKLAMNMIRQYADIPVSPEEYARRMIMAGTAVEGAEDISGGMEKVVVGRVLTCEDVEGTHLHECTVDVGGPEGAAHRLQRAPWRRASSCPWPWTARACPAGVKIKAGKLRPDLRGHDLLGRGIARAHGALPQHRGKGEFWCSGGYPLGADVKPIWASTTRQWI